MTIFNPNNETHSFKIIPRYYAELSNVSNVTLTVYDESKGKNVTISNLEVDFTCNGYLGLNFDATLIEKGSYQLKITNLDTNTLIFRGKAFATSKETQNYSINE